jgi:hypothetical protein
MFTIILKNEKLSFYNRLGLFIVLINLLYFINYVLRTHTYVNVTAIVVGIGVSFIGLVLNIGSASKNNKPRIPFAAIFTLLAVIWATHENFAIDKYAVFVAMIIFAFLDYNARKKTFIIFFDDRIELNLFRLKIYQWEKLGNVILKDRVLTLDFKDDRLMQAEIDQESWGVDEGAFNVFCKQQLRMDN